MTMAVDEAKLKGRVQEKDLRKKSGSDVDLDHAQSLLGHTTAQRPHAGINTD